MQCQSGGDEQRAVGAFEHRAERLDGAPVRRAVFGEFREIVVEGGMDHAIRPGCSAAQTVQILDVAAKHLGAAGGERPGARLRTRQAKHLMACSEKFLDDGRADKAGGTGDENTHHDFPFAERVLAALAARRDQVNG